MIDPEEHPARGPQSRPEPPRLPGYEISDVIGRGSTGIVYRARQLAVDREVALKVLHPELARKPRIVGRLQREARTTARLAHPHIVSAIDMGETDGLWWYAMEFVDGPTLATRLKQEGRLSEREALRLFIPLCEALEHAWEHGVVHRDIKPANILIDRARGARLADLGLAFADDDPSLTASGTGTLGTPHYMSPEQARSPADADVRSDIWSFGATLFHAVCGRAPFTGDSLAEVLSGVLYARLPDPHLCEPSLSKGLVLVLRKCLSRDPEARYATPRQLLLDLERVRERRMPKVRRRALDPVDRGPRTALVWASGVGLAAAAVLALAYVGWRSEEGAAGGDLAVPAFPPLESLEARSADEGDPRLFSLLGELELLEPEVPDALRGRFVALRTALRNRLREAVDALLRAVDQRVDARVAERDFVGARAALGAELERELFERTGFSRQSLPEVQREFVDARIDYYAAGIDENQEAAGRHLAERLDYYVRGTLLPRVEELRDEGRWRSAQELLDLGDAELLARVQFEDAGFPPDALAGYLEATELLLYGRAQELRSAWRTVDRSLARWVSRRADTLEAQLQDEVLIEGAGAELERSFEREIAARGVREGELHPDGLLFARGELDSRVRDLAELEEELRERRARSLIDEWRVLCEPLWSLREYASIAERFGRLEEQLSEMGGAADAPWRSELVRRAEVVRREAELLDGILRAAAERVRALDGETAKLLTGNIRRVGLVRVAGDPLAEGFEFLGESGVRDRISLRTLGAAGLEELAGLRDEGVERAPEDLLRLALFRYHEGDLDEAGRLSFDPDIPTEGLDGRVTLDLRDRILGGLETQEARQEQRLRDARAKLAVLERRDSSDPSLRVIAEELLRDFGDLPEVREQRGHLRALRDGESRQQGRASLEDVRRAFGLPRPVPGLPTSVERAGRDRVRLAFDFTAGVTGTWETGSWRDDLTGWIGEAGVSVADLDERGPRLVLREPLRIERGELELELTFEQPFDSGPPKLLVVSFVGYHLAFCGPSLSGDPRWLLDTRGLDPLLERVGRGEGQEDDALLRQGSRHTLVLRAGRGLASLEVVLDGRVLTRGLLRPAEPDPVIAVRSWEPVRLLGAEVESDY